MTVLAGSSWRRRISEMIVTPVACPDPPLLNHHGIHESTFLRLVVRLRTEDELKGLGKGPGGSLFVQEIEAASSPVIGADPYHLEAPELLIGARNSRVVTAVGTASRHRLQDTEDGLLAALQQPSWTLSRLFQFTNGAVTVSDAPGLGVSIHGRPLGKAAEACQERDTRLNRDDVGAMRERNPDYPPLMPKWQQ